jgi:hypothetical protein
VIVHDASEGASVVVCESKAAGHGRLNTHIGSAIPESEQERELSDERDDGKCEETEETTDDEATDHVGEVVDSHHDPTRCHHHCDDDP